MAIYQQQIDYLVTYGLLHSIKLQKTDLIANKTTNIATKMHCKPKLLTKVAVCCPCKTCRNIMKISSKNNAKLEDTNSLSGNVNRQRLTNPDPWTCEPESVDSVEDYYCAKFQVTPIRGTHI